MPRIRKIGQHNNQANPTEPMKKSNEAVKASEKKSEAKPEIEKLVRELEKQHDKEVKKLKEYQTTQTVLAADPEFKMAFVQHIVDVFSALGAETRRNADYWWGTNAHPWTGAKLAELLIKKRVPFSDDALTEMFEKLLGMALLTTTVVPCLEELIVEAEKRAGERDLSSRLRKVLERVAGAIAGKNLSPKAAQIWKKTEHAPVALDRKLVARIEGMLTGPLRLD